MTATTTAPAPTAELFPGIAAWGHRPHLDGIRAIAVYIVVLFHARVVAFESGFVGVDLFFVLSGYLITSLLLSEHSRNGRISIIGFYSRRVRRLLPVAVLAIVLVSLSLLATTPFTKRLRYLDDARSALLYFSNWNLIEQENDYFRQGRAPSPFLHFWSLSLEEQFYIAFPVVMAVVLFLLARRRRVSTVVVPLGVVMVASVALQAYWARHDTLRAYYGTDARVYQILAGSLLAVAFLARPPGRRLQQIGGWLAAGALLAFVAVSSNVVTLSASNRGLLVTAVAIAAIAGLESLPAGRVAKALSLRPVEWLGQISYGTYLFHWPLTIVLIRETRFGPWKVAIAAAIGATLVAAISQVLLELPIRRSPSLSRRPFPVVGTGLALSALAAVLVVPNVLESTRRPIYPAPGKPDARLGEAGRVPVPVPDALRTAYADQPDFVNCERDAVQDCLVVDGAGATILLVGDSHARMMLPALVDIAQARGLDLYANTWGGCPWQVGYVGADRSIEARQDCERAREDWYADALATIDPDVVVLVSFPYDIAEHLQPVGDAHRDLDEPTRYERLTEETLRMIVAPGREVILMDPIPTAGFDPIDCLAGAKFVGECVFDGRAPAEIEAPLHQAAAAVPEVDVADLDVMACPDLPDCYPVVDGIVVRRDESHLSTAYVVHAAQPLQQLLDAHLS